ncbi:hypothetical protein ILUMI_25939 [Ignelater luminosus]|uniref:PiggyBac transposable element-derived protein domain-containing protein n=1 Tax=Ignelater luminosus TaxID=2038154 RepID=A0A8K0FW26_IGNLU|nr:hypothetical protein ILUMI_25939 [Ignelater luminosus]
MPSRLFDIKSALQFDELLKRHESEKKSINRVIPLGEINCKIKIYDTVTPIDTNLLYQRILSTFKQDDELEEYFKFELSPIPQSLFDELGGEDVDVVVLMVALTPENKDIYLLKPGKGENKNVIYSSAAEQKRHRSIKNHLLFLHAASGCDTTSKIRGSGTKRPLRKEDIQQLADTFCADLESDVDPYENSGSEYLESGHFSSKSDLEPPRKLQILRKKSRQFSIGTDDNSKYTGDACFSSSSDFESSEENDALQNIPPSNLSANKRDLVGWDDVGEQFVHRMEIPDDKACTILADLNRSSYPSIRNSRDTCISTRRNIPQFEKRKRKRGEYESMHNNNSTIGYLWMDTKEVMVLSNCHGNESVEISRTGKGGIKIKLSCSDAIQYYNSRMGGVDLSDQLTGLYEVDRKSTKYPSIRNSRDTCISTRRNIPQFEKRKRKRGEYESMHNNNSTIGYLWMDTKEVMVLSNCHGNESVEISRTGKGGIKIKLSCSDAIQYYNSRMGGVDLSDQLTGLYEVDRKSTK